MRKGKKYPNNIALYVLTALMLLTLISPMPRVSAIVNNPGFETGDLTGWTTVGSVTAHQASDFTPSITPPEGSYFALLSTESGGDAGADIDGDGNNDFRVTIMSQTFTCETGIMSFYWSWITDEKDSMYDDFFLVRLDGTIILSGSQEDSSLSPFPNVPDDDVDYDGPGGLDFSQGRSNFVLFSIPISAGTHTIEFLVADNADPIFESGLMIDGITVTRVYEMPPRESVAVGGYYMPVDRLTILAPYLTLASLIGIVISVLLTRKRRKN